MKQSLLAGGILISLFLASTAMARPPWDEDGPGGRHGPPPHGRHGPPPEAIEACRTIDVGAACHFRGRFGEMLEGHCQTVRDDRVACVPDDAPPPPPPRGRD